MEVQFNTTIVRDDKYRGEVDVDVEVIASVSVEPDGYGTGDSPTLYEVNLESVKIVDSRDDEDGQEILSRLSTYTIDQLEDEAIREVA